MTANRNEETKVTVEMGSGHGGVDMAKNIAAGTIPSNDVMLDSITAAQRTLDQRGKPTNEQGQILAEDAQKVLEATKNLIVEKNSDGKLQEVLQQTKTAAQTGAQSGQKSAVQNQAGVVGSDLTQAARELATLLGQSTEMRGIFLDQFKTLRRLFWKRMQSNQGNNNNNFPSSSSSSSSHSSSGYTEGHSTGTSQPFSQQIGGTTPSIPSSYGTKATEVQEVIYDAVRPGQQLNTSQAAGLQITSNAATNFTPIPGQFDTTTPSSFPQQVGTTPSFPQQTGASSFQQTGASSFPQQTGASSFPQQTGASSLSQQFDTTAQQFGTTTPSYGTTVGSINNSADTRSTGYNNASNYDNDFKKITLTTEEKRELVDSWRTLLTQLGAKENYGTAMNQIFVLFDHLSDLKDTTTSDPKARQAANHGNEALYGVKELAERFMGDKTLDNLINMFRELNDFTNRNPELRRFGSDWRNFATETIKEPKLLHDRTYSSRMEGLVDRTVDWMNDRYFRNQTRAITDEIKDLFYAVKEDGALSEVEDSFSKLFRDLVMDQNGSFSMSQLTSSIPQFRNLLAPILIEQFNNIPIKRVSGTTPKYDFELSNIILNASDLLPDKFAFDLRSKGKVGVTSDTTDKMTTKLKLRISNITASMKNVNFYYLRKKMPKIEDEGVVNVAVLPPGASIKIVWEIMTSEKRPITLKYRQATCDIGNLKVDIVEAKHSIIDKMATKLFAGQIKSRIETSIVDSIADLGNGLADRMNRATRGKPQPKSAVKVGVDPKTGSATISNTQNTAPATVGSDKLY